MASFIDTEKRKTTINRGKSQSKASLKRVNDYIAQEDKLGEYEAIDLTKGKENEGIFDYIAQDNKIGVKLLSGINCNPSSAYDEMMVTKLLYNKTKGRQFKHFVHSYHKNEKDLSPEIAHEISLELAKHDKFRGYQMVLATHIDTEHIHTHFVINTVNLKTGKKWQHSEKDLKKIREYSNELCKEYGLKFSYVSAESNEYTRSKAKSMGELKAKEKGKSWKHEAYLLIEEARKTSTSKEEFIGNLESVNYKVRWIDSRKNITFTLPNGRKLNNDKLHPKERFSKEALIEQFSLNKNWEEERDKFQKKVKSETLQEIIFRTNKFLFDNPDQGDYKLPMSYLEGQALKEKVIEDSKGKGLDWQKDRER